MLQAEEVAEETAREIRRHDKINRGALDSLEIIGFLSFVFVVAGSLIDPPTSSSLNLLSCMYNYDLTGNTFKNEEKQLNTMVQCNSPSHF